jgi:radical SAM superfamily enzyme YgiQ (UPF0313 family)
MNTQTDNKERILLVLLPYWTSLIPPLGLSCLKGFLQKYGYHVKTIDANMENQFKRIYDKYFAALRDYIPKSKWGNFYNIGNDVLRNHLMAHMHYSEENQYIDLVKALIYNTFFTGIDRQQVLDLNKIAAEFYFRLEKYFLDILEREKPTLLGVSVYNGTLPASLFAFRLAKEVYPHIRTVMGGGVFADQLAPRSPNFNFLLEKAPYIDKIIVGEGENLFLKLLRNQLPASQRVYTLEDIDGETLDLDTVEVPDFSDFEVENYPTMASYVSRSCPFQCSFCSETLQWGKYRKKKAEQIVRELIILYKTYGYRLFLMGDSLLNPVIPELSEELLKHSTVIYWDGYLRADSLVCDPVNTLKWRRSGFYRARLGLESGSPHVLELMNKHLKPQQTRDAVSALASTGIKTTTYWVVGHPGETEADFQQTLDLIEELKDDIYEAECNPFNFYMGGQVNFERWKASSRLLYPGSAKDMLIAQTWTLDCYPTREEIYDRVCRFVHHCQRLDIPNPYSITDIHKADQRWKKLKKNAPPSLVEFKKRGIPLTECRQAETLIRAGGVMAHDENWGF